MTSALPTAPSQARKDHDRLRVKQCPPGCAFLFFDTSKDRIRRWCSMDECGGQEKAKRQTARRRSARANA